MPQRLVITLAVEPDGEVALPRAVARTRSRPRTAGTAKLVRPAPVRQPVDWLLGRPTKEMPPALMETGQSRNQPASASSNSCWRIYCDDGVPVYLPAMLAWAAVAAALLLPRFVRHLASQWHREKAKAPEASGEAAEERGAAAAPSAQSPAMTEEGGSSKPQGLPGAAGDRFPLGLARWLASTHVVVGHLYQANLLPQAYVFQWGFTWVPWFFMLSGFVLGTAHFRRPKDETVLEYIMRRSTVTYPLYAAFLIVNLCTRKSLPSFVGLKNVVLVGQAFLLQAWVPAWAEHCLQIPCWFLSSLILYWALFRPMARWCASLELRGTFAAMLLLCALPWLSVLLPRAIGKGQNWSDEEHPYGRMTTWEDWAVVFLKFHPLCYLHVFLLGMLLGRLRLLLDALAMASPDPSMWRAPLDLLLPLGYLGLALVFNLPALQPFDYKLSARLSILLPLQAAVLFGLAGLPSLPLPRLAAGFQKFDFLENYSYGVYIVQGVANQLWPISGQVNLLFYLLYVWGFGVFVCLAIQQPAQKWWTAHPTGRCAVPFALAGVLLGINMLVPQHVPRWFQAK